ncbi:MAG: acetyl-CoA carboxylase biotin carboxyl carrier protein subunit [Candidatus Promineifilaceae bacterium]
MRYKYYASVEDKSFEIEIGDGELFVNGEQYELDFRELPEGNLVSLLINNRSLEAAVDFEDDLATVLLKGELYEVTVQDERAYRLAQARGTEKEVTGNVELKSPMPGIIIAVPANVGDVVKKGDKVVILESMKMENELRAPRDGVILVVNTAAGDSVEKGQVLAVIGDAEGA